MLFLMKLLIMATLLWYQYTLVSSPSTEIDPNQPEGLDGTSHGLLFLHELHFLHETKLFYG